MQMKVFAATLASLCLICASSAQSNPTKSRPGAHSMLTRNDVRMVAPALDQYTQDRVLGDLWKRPGLSPRDRSIITLAVLITRNQTIEMPYYLVLALDNGVKPREISEIITHLAFYSGWENAMSAVAAATDVFAQRRNRALDNGLGQAEASEVFTQLAFYAGWPNVFSALPAAKEVFDKRR